MRKLVMLVIAVVCTAIVAAHSGNVQTVLVPDTVKSSFSKKYPDVKSPDWQVKEDKYSAAFKEGGKNVEAFFDSEGNFLSTHTEVKRSELPSIVVAGLQSSQFSDWKITSAAFVETKEKREYYHLTIRKGKELMTLNLDKDGNTLTK